MNGLLSHILLILSFFSCYSCQGSITQTPTTACVGESITVSCVLTPPDATFRFLATVSSFPVGDSDTRLQADQINSNNAHPVNLTRLSVVNNAGTSTRLSATITLNPYQSSDEGLRIGCIALYALAGTTNPAFAINEIIRLNQSVPSAPSLQSSISNFNTANCSADISLSWNTPPSNRSIDRYFLYLNGSPLATTNSTNHIHSTILNINTDYQYSVTAMNCAGNSTSSSIDVSIASYSLKLVKCSQFGCSIDYVAITGDFTFYWGLSAPTQPSGISGLDISYSLQLIYSYSRQGVIYTYTNSTSFTLPSSQLSYNTVLTPHNFTQLDGVKTNIVANLMIVQQCGQSFNGTTIEYSLNSITSKPNEAGQLTVLSSISVIFIVVIVVIAGIGYYFFRKRVLLIEDLES